ncbi:histone deacetylase [Streptacidiphilus sp. 4-A2]|nr:histone deacetylase [Streptacidiphilus sp. 4-A2]
MDDIRRPVSTLAPYGRDDPAPLGPEEPVWYAAYGSNMHADRLACYIAGGRPSGAARVYPGCRDRRLPRRTVPVLLPGLLYFALESLVWTGGMAFYDPAPAGEKPGQTPGTTPGQPLQGTPARAYLITAGQFADIAAQEMHRPPGADLDLARVLAAGRDRTGPGRYQTLVCPGALDGIPLCTFTAPWALADAELSAPSAGYLRTIAGGLAEAHRWPPARCADYLATRPGAAGHWSTEDLLDVLRRPPL